MHIYTPEEKTSLISAFKQEKAQGLSGSKAADKLHVGYSTIQSWMNRLTKSSPVKRIADLDSYPIQNPILALLPKGKKLLVRIISGMEFEVEALS